MEDTMKTGSCECGAVQFRSEGPWRAITACHCGQCRKSSGNYWAATAVPTDMLEITKSDALKWYWSSDTAQRGFCTECGSSLFYKRNGVNFTSIGAGCIDGASGLTLAKHIFMDDKGDYYEIVDGVEQVAQY
jgi:hypothetical protein